MPIWFNKPHFPVFPSLANAIYKILLLKKLKVSIYSQAVWVCWNPLFVQCYVIQSKEWTKCDFLKFWTFQETAFCKESVEKIWLLFSCSKGSTISCEANKSLMTQWWGAQSDRCHIMPVDFFAWLCETSQLQFALVPLQQSGICIENWYWEKQSQRLCAWPSASIPKLGRSIMGNNGPNINHYRPSNNE